jgi:sialate O-acetylesterase
MNTVFRLYAARALATKAAVLLSVAMFSPLHALEMPGIFSDHMVLQQQRPVPLWGKADPGTTVTVIFGDQSSTAQTNADGTWQVWLQALTASFEPQTLVVQAGDKQLQFTDVLVGEVWLASGQSNMQWRIRQSLDADLEVLLANHPAMRLYQVSQVASDRPRFSDAAVWQLCSPETIAEFSAVAYHFGRDLRGILDVPVGLINASWGGTPAIAWTREAAFTGDPLFAEKLAEWQELLANYDENLATWKSKLDAWLKANQLVLEGDESTDGADVKVVSLRRTRQLGAPREPMGPDSPHRPASLANGMLATVAPYAVRGAIWYQGETDAGWAPAQYAERLRVMIEDWRRWWQIDDLHFGIVQLAGYMRTKDAPADDPWPHLRESQRRAARDIPHCGLAVTIDIGEANDIHPQNKQTVGRRLARWALTDVYNRLSLRGGPELETAAFNDATVQLTFQQTGSGLHIIDGHELGGFTLAGEDGVFHAAQARIENPSTIIVSSELVTQPVHLRYAWQNNPTDANLGNKQRLPASPFEVQR